MKTLITAAIALLTIAFSANTTKAGEVEVLILSGGATDVCYYSNGMSKSASGVLAEGASVSGVSWTTHMWEQETAAPETTNGAYRDEITIRGDDSGGMPNWGTCSAQEYIPGVNSARTIQLYIDQPGGHYYDNHGGSGGGPVALITKKLDPGHAWTIPADEQMTLHRWQGRVFPGQGATFVEVMAVDPATQSSGDVLLGYALFGGGAGPAGADGADGADGAAGSDGSDGAAGAQGPQGKQGPQGDSAPCVDCDAVASAAVDLACKIMVTNPPSTVQDLADCAAVIVNSLQISANICETDCNIGAEIDAALADK